MKKFSLKNLFDSNRFVLFFAIIVSVISWVTVAMTTSQTIDLPVRDVPVNLEMQAEALEENGLSLIGQAETMVDVVVSGQRTVVGSLEPEHLLITARISGITEPNTYDLSLISGQQTQGYNIISITPSTIRVRLDQISSKDITVDPVVEGISTPPGYMQDTERITPATVKVTGPLSELEKIESCVAIVELNQSLTKTYSAEVPIVLLDAAGEVIDPNAHHIALDYEVATVVVPALRIKQLPLQVGFTHLPMGFPEDELREYMILSNTSIRAAGPVSIMNNYNEIRLGYIDLRTLSKEDNVFSFDVSLPSDQFTNMDNVNTITVEFDSEYWSSAAFNIRPINTLNEPLKYDVTLLTNSLSNVIFFGQEDLIAELTADDIVAEVNLSDKELTPGQYRYPVRISAPSKGMVWPVGEYTVIIQVVERPEEASGS